MRVVFCSADNLLNLRRKKKTDMPLPFQSDTIFAIIYIGCPEGCFKVGDCRTQARHKMSRGSPQPVGALAMSQFFYLKKLIDALEAKKTQNCLKLRHHYTKSTD